MPAVSAWLEALDSDRSAADSDVAAFYSDTAAFPSEVLALEADEAELPSATTAASRAAIDSVFADKACVNRLLICVIRAPIFASTRAHSDSKSVLLTIPHRLYKIAYIPAAIRIIRDFSTTVGCAGSDVLCHLAVVVWLHVTTSAVLWYRVLFIFFQLLPDMIKPRTRLARGLWGRVVTDRSCGRG